MACFQIARSGFYQASAFHSGPVRRRFASPEAFGIVRCRLQYGGENDSNGEERPELLFMKELRRRGMVPMMPISLLEVEVEEEEGKKINGVRATAAAAAAEFKKGMTDKRERSMGLNIEGIEGSIPRSKLHLTIAGTFFLGFGPLILITLTLFAALYFYLAPSFLHDDSMMPLSVPPYVDPYAQLEDERIDISNS